MGDYYREVISVSHKYSVQEALEKQIEDALVQMKNAAFCTVIEYGELVAQGALVMKHPFEDDGVFQDRHPCHPLALDKRIRRIYAADTIRDCSQLLRESLRCDLLDGIHKGLFDCSAAVRHSLAQALLHLDSAESIPYLEELLHSETESRMVLRSARLALQNSRLSLSEGTPTTGRVILLFSRREDLIERLNVVAGSTGCSLYLPRRKSDGMSLMSGVIQIIDRWFMGEEQWHDWCQNLIQQRTERDCPPDEKELRPVCAKYHAGNPFLVIIDRNMEASVTRFQHPPIDPGKLFYVEGGPDDLVGELVYRALTHGDLTMENICDTVNDRRMVW